jgi:hypothetical protein
MIMEDTGGEYSAGNCLIFRSLEAFFTKIRKITKITSSSITEEAPNQCPYTGELSVVERQKLDEIIYSALHQSRRYCTT